MYTEDSAVCCEVLSGAYIVAYILLVTVDKAVNIIDK